MKRPIFVIAPFLIYVFAAYLVVNGREEPLPQPREVVVPEPHIYTVNVQIDGKVVASAGADYLRDLEELLRTLAARYALHNRMYDENANLKALPVTRFAIWDRKRQEWYHPGGKRMPETWDGWLTVEVTIHVGSWNG